MGLGADSTLANGDLVMSKRELPDIFRTPSTHKATMNCAEMRNVFVKEYDGK